MTGVSEQMHIYLTSAAYVKMDFFFFLVTSPKSIILRLAGLQLDQDKEHRMPPYWYGETSTFPWD